MIRLTRLRLRHVALAAVLATSVSCLGSDVTGVPIEQTTFADTLHINLAQFTRLPSGMYVRDDTVGTGTTAVFGDTVSVRYAGYLSSGTLFDTNNTPSRPVLTFLLGAGQLIPGFEIGVQGMKVGGTRTMIVPAELGYGAGGVGLGNGVSIPPYSVLIFTVNLVSSP